MRREEKVLVVEKEPAIADALASQFNCECATDGWEAISKLENGQYAAIVIDSDAPGHSGYGVLTYLREEVGEKLDHVLVMTGQAEADDVRRKVGQSPLVVDRKDAAAELARVLDTSVA